MDSESILGFHVSHGSHVGVQNNSEKSLGNLILLLCKTWGIFCHCFENQHGRLITWVKTKNSQMEAAWPDCLGRRTWNLEIPRSSPPPVTSLICSRFSRFNSSVALVNSQPVCLLPVVIVNLLSLFQYFVSLTFKSPNVQLTIPYITTAHEAIDSEDMKVRRITVLVKSS